MKISSPSEIGKDGTFSEQQVESADVTTVDKDIVTFHNDAGVRVSDIVQAEEIGSSVLDVSEMSNPMSIISFLERPKRLVSGSFDSTDVYGTLGGVAFPPLYMPDTGMTSIITNKLQGVAGIRYDLEFELVVNATRFTQGLYNFYFCYTGGVCKDRSLAWFNTHATIHMNRSQLHHVKIDLNCDTRVTLKVPWVSAYDFMPLARLSDASLSDRRVGNLGYIHLAPFGSGSAMKPAGETASFQIYWRMTNIKLIGAMAAPQMDISMKEAKSKNAGPIESVSRKISAAAAYLTKVPIISPYAGGLKWASDITANVASVFGWSRPQNESTAMRIKRKPLMYTANVDALDNSDSIGFTTTNSVEVLPGFSGTKVDELDMKQFASRYSYILGVNWDSSSAVGTSLWTFNVSPNTYVSTTTPVGYVTTPLTYVASNFKFWRGSIRYRFTFVKTEFHSGRIAFCFNPRVGQISGTNTYAESDYMYKDIIDLRYQNVVEFTVPYIATTPYLPVQDISTGGVYTENSYVGVLALFVVDKIKAPSSVEQTVRIVVEMAGGDDIEFAGPKPVNKIPVINVTPQSGIDLSACADVSKAIGNMSLKSDTLDPSKAAMGERILSLRTLLKRFTGSFSHSTATVGSNAFAVYPFVVQWYDSTNSSLYCDPDLYSQLGSIFLLSRGGVRIKYVNPNPRVPGSVVDGSTNEFQNLAYAWLYDRMNSLAPTFALPTRQFFQPVKLLTATTLSSNCHSNIVYFNPLQEYGGEISVPQYSPYHSRPNAETRAGGAYQFPQSDLDFSSYLPVVMIKDNTLNSYEGTPSQESTPFMMRAGAEDTNFGFFCSIPPMFDLDVN